MKVDSVHIFFREKLTCSAQIEVPGLGTVDIKQCLSKDTADRVAAECVEALKIKLNMNFSAAPEVRKPTVTEGAEAHG